MTIRKAWIACGPALIALAQMTTPSSAGASYMMVPICGEYRGQAVPIRIDDLAPGAPILCAAGPAAALLRGWKVAQTLIEVWSGVATATRDIIDAARTVSPHETILRIGPAVAQLNHP